MAPTIGRIVHYTLSAGDVAVIEESRTLRPVGGNGVAEGDIFPAVVVRVNGGASVNLKVLLDGYDEYWATSRTESTVPGTWAWPPRV